MQQTAKKIYIQEDEQVRIFTLIIERAEYREQ